MTQPIIQLPPVWIGLLPGPVQTGVYAAYLKNPSAYAVALGKVTGGTEPVSDDDAKKVASLLIATTLPEGDEDIARAAVELNVAGAVVRGVKQPKIAGYSLKGLALASLSPRTIRGLDAAQATSDSIAGGITEILVEMLRRKISGEIWKAFVEQFGIGGWTQVLWDSFIGKAFRTEATNRIKTQLGMAAEVGYKSPILPIGTTVTGVSQFLAPWANNYAETVVDQFDQTNANAIRESLLRYVDQGLTQAEMANRIRMSYGLDPKSAFALDAYRTQVMQQRPNQRGIVARMVLRYADRLLENRTKFASQTAANTAMNYGRLLVFSDAIAKGELPFDTKKVWVTALDERVCPICRPMDGISVPMDEPFSIRMYSGAKKHRKVSAMINDMIHVELIVPPAHPNCRCTIVLEQEFDQDMMRSWSERASK